MIRLQHSYVDDMVVIESNPEERKDLQNYFY